MSAHLAITALLATLVTTSPPAMGQIDATKSAAIDVKTSANEGLSFSGRVLERGTKRPLSGINVFVLPAKVKATTDDNGRFQFVGLSSGPIEIVVNAADYKRLNASENLATSLEKNLYLEKNTYQGLEATVVGQVRKRDDRAQTLRSEEFLTLPGANGDPVKAVQNLPGVARANGISSQVIIQGSSPRDTVYLLDEHVVPLAFHFGGLTSTVTPEAIEAVDYLSAGYGPEFGRAIGGIVGLRLKAPASDRRKGFVFMDTVKSGAMIETPLDEKSSLLVAGRYSYIGYVLSPILKNNASFDLTVVPSFGDLNFSYLRKSSPRDEWRMTGVISHDELSFLFREPVREAPSVRGSFSNVTNFYRFIPQWIHRFEDDSLLRFSLGAGQNTVHFDIGNEFFDVDERLVSQRAEYETQVSAEWKTFVGVDNIYSKQDVSLRLPVNISKGGVSNPSAPSTAVDTRVLRDDLVLAVYSRNIWKRSDSRWTWMPNLRVDYFNITNELRPQPRLAARYQYDESLKLTAATGVYYQRPNPEETSQDYGNPDVKSPFALHYTIGAEKDFRPPGEARGWTANSNFFYRSFQNQVITSSTLIERNGVLQVERYNNDGRGRAYGLEWLIKYDATPWQSWLSYTLSRSLRNNPGESERSSQYDQTHNINLVGSYDFANNWKLSGRLRYVTGNPNTPITGGVFDSDNDVYVPVRGAFFSERNADFFQMDVRVDKKWIKDEWILSAYLDIVNLTNQKNSEGVRYSYDYSQKQNIMGLPILPTLGVKGEF